MIVMLRGIALFLMACGFGGQAAAEAVREQCPVSSRGEPRPILVALLDTGIDAKHPFLREAMWRHPGETGTDATGRDKASNGVDDDGNGFVDDVDGWNFVDGDNNTSDPQGHGTHIAGLILSRSVGLELAPDRPVIAPRASPVRFMALKYSTGTTLASKASRGFREALAYALENGADVIHISGGGYGPVRGESALFAEAQRRGVTVVAASGNKRPDDPDRLFFPAAYTFANIVSVTATDLRGQLLPTSNSVRGRRDVREVGQKVFSILPGGSTGFLTGTSQAAGAHCGKLIERRLSRCASSGLLVGRL